MTDTTPAFTTNTEIMLAFVIRLTWDRAADAWRILLKPVNGQEAQLFSDIEAALVYLERVMQKEHDKRKE